MYQNEWSHNSPVFNFSCLIRSSLIGIAIVLGVLFCSTLVSAQEILNTSSPSVESSDAPKKQNTIEFLTALIELQTSLKQEIRSTKAKLKETISDAERSKLTKSLNNLDRQLSNTDDDFERIATGVDTTLFVPRKPGMFSWRNELSELLKPAIQELKQFTVNARKKTKLKEAVAEYNKLIPVTKNAVHNIESLLKKNPDSRIKNRLQSLLPQWKNIASRVQNKRELAQLELTQMKETGSSLIETSRNSLRNFFRSRGLYLLIAIGTVLAILLLSRFLYHLLIRCIPAYGQPRCPFYVRLIDIVYRVTVVFITIFGVLLVFYLAEDWVLLSLTIIFFLVLGLAIRHAVPTLWQQSRLMLNIGAVREGERIIINDLPWLVIKIHLFCTLENPNLNIQLRLPIEQMVGRCSRPLKTDELWFPCKKDDWVILSDGFRGKVIYISNEMVELVERGGAHKTYRIKDFLRHSPKNLSRNFRVRVPFGISYHHQQQSVHEIPDILKAAIQNRIEKKGYAEKLLNLQVEFHQAGDSSLNLIILADFKGSLAPIYSRLKRSIQKWCVEASSENAWEIPFPQLVVNWPKRQKDEAS